MLAYTIFADTILFEGGGHTQTRHDRPGRWVWLGPDVDRAGGEVIAGVHAVVTSRGNCERMSDVD